MRYSLTIPAAMLLALGACRGAIVETAPSPGVQPAPPTADMLPAGSQMRVNINQALSTETSRVGDRFTATVTQPIVAQNGQTVIPAGAVVHGSVTGLAQGRRLGDQAAIRVNFDQITFGNQTYPFSADVIEADVQATGQPVGQHAAIGAAAGAVLGAVIGGGLRDILIGGALGAGAGTVISLGLGDVDARLPAGTPMTLQTTSHVYIR